MTSKEWRDQSREYERSYPNSYLVHYPGMSVTDEVAEMTIKDFERLDEYSTSVPTGVFLGKCWKARVSDGQTDEWYLRWYGWPKNGNQGDASINTRKITIVTNATRMIRAELRRLEGDPV